MKGFIYQAHILLGLVVSIPVLGWAFSGFLYSLPSTVKESRFEAIDQARVKIGSTEAMRKAQAFTNSGGPVSALTLQNRNGVVEYEAISGVRSVLVNAETGETSEKAPPSLTTRFVRQAHFYFFAYPYNALLTGLFSALACISVLSGMYLNVVYWKGRLRRVP